MNTTTASAPANYSYSTKIVNTFNGANVFGDLVQVFNHGHVSWRVELACAKTSRTLQQNYATEAMAVMAFDDYRDTDVMPLTSAEVVHNTPVGFQFRHAGFDWVYTAKLSQGGGVRLIEVEGSTHKLSDSANKLHLPV